MKTPVLLYTVILLTVLIACKTIANKKVPEDTLSGVYASETAFESGTQWDTLNILKIRTGDPDSFRIFYVSRYIKKLPGGQWSEPSFIRDTFPAVFNTLYKVLQVGPTYQPMHIDTSNGTAMFGGTLYKKVR